MIIGADIHHFAGYEHVSYEQVATRCIKCNEVTPWIQASVVVAAACVLLFVCVRRWKVDEGKAGQSPRNNLASPLLERETFAQIVTVSQNFMNMKEFKEMATALDILARYTQLLQSNMQYFEDYSKDSVHSTNTWLSWVRFEPTRRNACHFESQALPLHYEGEFWLR